MQHASFYLQLSCTKWGQSCVQQGGRPNLRHTVLQCSSALPPAALTLPSKQQQLPD